MQVRKRDGRLEPVDFTKIYDRLEKIRLGVAKDGTKFGEELVGVDTNLLVQKVISQVTNGISTSELDQYAASTAATMVLEHPGFYDMAGRIAVSNHHRETHDFYTTCKFLYENKGSQGEPMPLIDHVFFKIVQQNRVKLEQAIDYSRDYRFDFFGFKTLEKSYLLRTKNELAIVERPQHMWMRVAVGIHGLYEARTQQKTPNSPANSASQNSNVLEAIIETYNELSTGRIMHATPTLFNAGCPNGQFLSCFLMDVEDSLQGIFDALRQTALISKSCGGLGHSFSSLRAADSRIRGTNGVSRGIVPICKVFNETARLVDQSGRRKGSFAIYLEMFHADLMEFLDLKKTHGSMDLRALDLFYALWMPDLFMKRLERAITNPKETVYWSLMCPDECPGLTECYGDAYEELYTKYEREHRYRRQVNILEIWTKILDSQKETGMPYVVNKDQSCYKSNQKNIGILRSSNLCAEILEVSTVDETACCNLGSIPLSAYVTSDKSYDFKGLANAAAVLTRNLDKIIDINIYPTPQTELSNKRHRPIGIGVQGLADTFYELGIPFESPEARGLNREIFETIQYSALKTSVQLAREKGAYETFKGSPASQGVLQPDLWASAPNRRPEAALPVYSGRWDWDTLRTEIKQFGLRNSLLTALMPTASTAQIMGNCESFEPVYSNLFVRSVLAGEYIVCNRHLQRDMLKRGLWTPDITRQLVRDQGSVQNIKEMPKEMKDLYKTAFEVSQKTLIDLSAERGPFIDQSQSFNWHVTEPTNDRLTSMHLYAYKRGLKTCVYYTRRKAVHQVQQFTVPVNANLRTPKSTTASIMLSPKQVKEPEAETVPALCRRDDPDCMSCQG
jgi:ribonucleoside-diphosphate reductase alpha subunit